VGTGLDQQLRTMAQNRRRIPIPKKASGRRVRVPPAKAVARHCQGIHFFNFDLLARGSSLALFQFLVGGDLSGEIGSNAYRAG
jgi:hypothetical protein